MTGRRLTITVLISLLLHAAAVAAVLLLLRGPIVVAEPPEKPVSIELVMVEHAGNLGPPSPSTPLPSEPPPPVEPAVETPGETPVESRVEPREDRPEPPAGSRSEPVETSAPPSATPIVSLHGTDSPSDAKAFGDGIIPAAPDAVFHNRPPEYPIAAARAGQTGAVVLTIHVSPSGHAMAVDVTRSSRYPLLDEAARTAVLRWRFLPAVKDGKPVESETRMQFLFEPE